MPKTRTARRTEAKKGVPVPALRDVVVAGGHSNKTWELASATRARLVSEGFPLPKPR